MIHKLRRCRFELGISLDELYRRTGIHQAKLSRIERGIIIPTKDICEAIAKVIGMPAQQLFNAEDYIFSQPIKNGDVK